MHAPKTTAVTTSHDADRTFAALVETVESGSYTLTTRDDASRTIAFTSGKTAFSWGHEYLATVTPAASGANLEVVAGGLDDKPKALLDGRKNVKAGAKVVEAVKAALGH